MNFVKFKRDALQQRKRMETLERIKVHEFRREIRRKRMIEERHSRETHFGSTEKRKIFEKGCWPFLQADPSHPGPCDHPPKHRDCIQKPSSSFLSSPRKSRTEMTYFEPGNPVSSFRKGGGVKFIEADRVTTVSITQNPFLPEPVKVQVQNNWGPFQGRRELIKAKGRALENVRSTGSLSRSLAQMGITLSDLTLSRLFEYLQKKRIDREYRYNQVYGAAAQLREKRSSSNGNSRGGPENRNNPSASKDVRTIEGSLALQRGGRSTMNSSGTRSDPTEWSGTAAKRDDFLREYRRHHLKDIVKRDDVSSQRDLNNTTSLLSSSRSQEVEPFQYYIPDELRGRDIAELRTTLKNIWMEEREKGQKQALEVAKNMKHDPITSDLSKVEIDEFNGIVSRRFSTTPK